MAGEMSFQDVYPDVTEADLQSLDALVVTGMPFDEAFLLLQDGPPRDQAEQAYNDFQAWHEGPAPEAEPSVDPLDN